MRLLLDTHLLIWAAGDSDRLSVAARGLLNDQSNELFFSAISLWEVAIKSGLRQTGFDVEPRALRRGLLENNYAELAFTSEHACGVSSLPRLHKDPFDRALMAQAVQEGLVFLTADKLLGGYAGLARLV